MSLRAIAVTKLIAHGASITLRGVLGTPALLAAITAVTVLQLLFTYAPFMETFFGTRPLSLQQLAQIALVCVAVLGVLELEKLAVRAVAKPRRGRGPKQDSDPVDATR